MRSENGHAFSVFCMTPTQPHVAGHECVLYTPTGQSKRSAAPARNNLRQCGAELQGMSGFICAAWQRAGQGIACSTIAEFDVPKARTALHGSAPPRSSCGAPQHTLLRARVLPAWLCWVGACATKPTIAASCWSVLGLLGCGPSTVLSLRRQQLNLERYRED